MSINLKVTNKAKGKVVYDGNIDGEAVDVADALVDIVSPASDLEKMDVKAIDNDSGKDLTGDVMRGYENLVDNGIRLRDKNKEGGDVSKRINDFYGHMAGLGYKIVQVVHEDSDGISDMDGIPVQKAADYTINGGKYPAVTFWNPSTGPLGEYPPVIVALLNNDPSGPLVEETDHFVVFDNPAEGF